MKKTSLLLFLAALLTACGSTPPPNPATGSSAGAALPPGVTLLRTEAGADRELSIPYSKYLLDNGLTVILHEDHSDPMVHVDVTYHVGSSREEPGRSGFAHLFEHMMFEGSANVGAGEFSKILTNAGGTLNGSTNSDRTNYYETLPVNQLETALWLEADRMGLLLDAISQEQFDIQRAAVKNERGQRVDNQPYGRTSETMMRNLYPPDHPYSWPVIGWIEDLDAAQLDDLRRFFLRWYGPNNATLTIGGDIDPERTLAWVARYFGPIPAGPGVAQRAPRPAHLERERYVTLEDNVHLPAIAMLIPTVYYRHPDEAPLDAATKILGQGRTSLLYQRLVQSGRALSASASHACRELACEMAFVVVQNPSSGETLADMEAAIRATLDEFAGRGVSPDDLDKFITGFEAGQVFGMQSLAGKVGSLALGELFSDDPGSVAADIERYRAVSTDDVMRTFRRYIQDQPAVILSVVPDGQPELAARPQNFDYRSMASGRHAPAAPEVAEPPQLRSWADDFDRSLKPAPGPNPAVMLPPVLDRQLANGARLLAVRNEETPTVTVHAMFAMGQRDEPPGQAGLARLTTAMMSEATRQRSAAEFSEALERIGASVGVSSSQYETTITLNVLERHLDTGMALMMERLLEPAFRDDDFDRIKTRTLEALMQARKSGAALASRAAGVVLAGPDHPLSYPGGGLPSTVGGITLEDVKAFYAAHIPTSLQGVLVSSSLPEGATLASLQPLGELPVAPVDRSPIAGLQAAQERGIYLVQKDGAAQSTLRMVHPSLPYDALGDFYLAGLMNFNLGGTFDSRLNLNLREDKGYTYGIRSGFSGGREMGSFYVSAEVEKASTTEAISEILGELEAFAADGMTPAEFRYLQNAIGQRDALRYETPGAKLGLLAQILRYDLPLDYRKRQWALLQDTDRAALNALAARLIEPENIAIVVVGDIPAIRPDLESLALPMRLLDADGNPVETAPMQTP
jgi:zinc protease